MHAHMYIHRFDSLPGLPTSVGTAVVPRLACIRDLRRWDGIELAMRLLVHPPRRSSIRGKCLHIQASGDMLDLGRRKGEVIGGVRENANPCASMELNENLLDTRNNTATHPSANSRREGVDSASPLLNLQSSCIPPNSIMLGAYIFRTAGLAHCYSQKWTYPPRAHDTTICSYSH